MAESRRRVPDRMLWLGLGIAVALLIAAVVVAILSYVNPDVAPLDLPTASSR